MKRFLKLLTVLLFADLSTPPVTLRAADMIEPNVIYILVRL